MGKLREPEKAILFIGILYNKEDYCEKAFNLLEPYLGESFFVTKQIKWIHTEYYRDELGWPIYRRFIAFKKVIDPSEIKEIKLLTNQLEEYLSINGKRTVNLDPGYVTLSKVVLATTKNYTHRIYLGKGIYAEVTLYYKDGSFKDHIFTYKDYKSDTYKNIFQRIREYLKKSS